MKTSNAGLMFLIGNEGIVLSTYLDSKGIPTIGVGHTKAAGGIDPDTFKGTLSMAQAMDLLRQDITKYENDVNGALKVPVTQAQFDALVSFHYNTGAIRKAELTQSLNEGKRKLAAQQFMNWVKPPEITPRREAERKLFETGVYPTPLATAYPVDAKRRVIWGKGTRINIAALLGNPRPTIPPEPEPAPVPVPTTPPAWVAPVTPKAHPIADLLAAIVSAFSKKG